jgi:hypothetical protein
MTAGWGLLLFLFFVTDNLRVFCRSKLIPTLFMQYDLELVEPEKEWETKCWWFVMQTGLHVRLTERSAH